ncbi:hypothetical protein IWQ52_004270 [Labrenzia sp. EL_159]|nr:hypothetical protein [Labrenzia sp. EL_162]MBG6196734.1 hypothetical protein [Labrenzia sp. EL_159]
MADGDLFEDDEYGADPFADAGDALERQQPEKRRPGRPPGSLNRKTKEFEKYFQAKGFTDPLTAMAQFITADPVALQAWFIEHEQAEVAVGKQIRKHCPTLWDIQKERMAVAAALGPYLHGKKPVEIAIIDERLPHLVIDLGTNQLEEGEAIAGMKALSLGSTIDATPNENKDLEERGE